MLWISFSICLIYLSCSNNYVTNKYTDVTGYTTFNVTSEHRAEIYFKLQLCCIKLLSMYCSVCNNTFIFPLVVNIIKMTLALRHYQLLRNPHWFHFVMLAWSSLSMLNITSLYGTIMSCLYRNVVLLSLSHIVFSIKLMIRNNLGFYFFLLFLGPWFVQSNNLKI